MPVPVAWKLPRAPTDSLVGAAADASPTSLDKLFGEVGLYLANGPLGLDGELGSPVSAAPAAVLSP